MNVLVLDLTHGGDVLALTYRSRGEEVTAVDIYGTAEQYLVDHLRNEGIAVARTTPSKKFDLAVVPIHCPPAMPFPTCLGKKGRRSCC